MNHIAESGVIIIVNVKNNMTFTIINDLKCRMSARHAMYSKGFSKMKKNKILTVIISLAITAAVLPCRRISAETTDWTSLYRQQLLQFMKSEDCTPDSAFSLVDISCDSIPELIISEGTAPEDKCRIYTYSRYHDQYFNIGSIGSEGIFGYSDRLGVIRETSLSGDTETQTFYQMKNLNNLTKIMSCTCNTINNVHTLNGNRIDRTTYLYALKDYPSEDFVNTGRDKPVTAEEIENVLTYNWRKLYSDELKKLRESSGYTGEWSFILWDINSDGIPELFVSTGSDEILKQVRIYTIYNEKLDFLGAYTGSSLFFDPENNQIFISSSYAGKTFKKVLSLENGILKNVAEFESFHSGNEYIITLNGEEISYDEYTEQWNCSYERSLFFGGKNQLGEKAVEYVLGNRSFNLTEEIKHQYIQVLVNNASHSAYFDLADVNGDSTAELIIFSQPDGFSIYTADNENSVKADRKINCGLLNYNAENQLLNYNMGWREGDKIRYDKMTGSHIENVLSCNKTMTFNEDGSEKELIFEVNGIKVSSEQYDIALAEYEKSDSSVAVGIKYDMSLKGIEQAFYPGNSLIGKLKMIMAIEVPSAAVVQEDF